nr:MAG TPA: hypothetical protein [Caudoviricetes sp.]
MSRLSICVKRRLEGEAEVRRLIPWRGTTPQAPCADQGGFS